MRKDKKQSLKRNLALSFIIIVVLLICSVINFQLFSAYHDQYDSKVKEYNITNSLFNELDLTVNELDRLINLYLDSNDEQALNNYNNFLAVYQGELPRDSRSYPLYSGQTIPFRTLLMNQITLYNDSYILNTKDILNLVDEMIVEQKSLIENNQGILNTSAALDNSLNHETLIRMIKDSIIQLSSDEQVALSHLNRSISIFGTLFYTFISLMLLFGTYFMLKIYILVLKPVMAGADVVNQINHGNEFVRISYKYNNEVTELIKSFNKYIDISQNSLNLIEDQYNRLKLYSDVGEINYFEYSYRTHEIKIFYSKKFVEKYHLSNHIIIYSVKNYLTMVHPNDINAVKEQLSLIVELTDTEYKLDFRIMYPQSKDYCYISSIGQIQVEKENYFIGVQLDITDLKNTENKLQEQEEQYRLIVENSTDLIAKYSQDGDILYASKSFKDVFKGNKVHITEYNDILKVSNDNWMNDVLKPPYSTNEVILIDTLEGEKWFSWNNDAVLKENSEIDYVISVGHDITQLQIMNDKLKYDAEHDILTNLFNRRGLFNQLEKLNQVETLAAFFIDINNFKNINDFYGHEVGDKIISLLADDLIEYEKYRCIIGRLSGDEFLVLLPNYHKNNSLDFLKNSLNQNMQKNYRVHSNDIYISSSIGYALYPEDTDDFDKLISYADISMYESKIIHFDHCLRFTKDMYMFINNKVEIAHDLKIAMDNDEFEVYFQTITNIRTQRVDFLESLVRWNSSKGLIMPNDFIPIAEETGFMQSLDYLILDKAFKYFSAFKIEMENTHTKLSINVSPITLLRNNFPQRLVVLAKKNMIREQDICVEISENTFVNNIELSRHQIKALRDLGFIVALDDFGREYSSLSILNRLDVDIIKIDQLFTSNLDLKTNIEIIKMIIKIAKLTHNLVIAEGVEKEEQKLILDKLGCSLMQGYYFSIPEKMNVIKEFDKIRILRK